VTQLQAVRFLTLTICCVAAAATAVSSQTPSGEDAAPLNAEALLRTAFTNRYEVDLISRIELLVRNSSGQERRRRFRAASKVIDGRVHSVGRLVWPHHLRGMTILTIEARERDHDAFVYLPSLGKVRRVSTAQRWDSFLGSDVTYEDLERRRVEEYELTSIESKYFAGEEVYRIRATPRRDFNYSEVLFVIAQSDAAILDVQYFKEGESEPYRAVSAPRRFMVEESGHVLPTRITVHNYSRGTTTEVTFEDLKVNHPIDDRLFSLVTLEQKRKLPD
jgi:hypothetical protein